MKLGLILSAILLGLSFTVKASEQPKAASDELPIVEFDNKKDMNQPQVQEIKLPESTPQQEAEASKKLKKKKNQLVIGDSSADISVGLIASKKTKSGKSAEKVDEEDFGRLDREMEVLK
jgi:hypothetical protein